MRRDEIEYLILKPFDIEKYRKDLTEIMETILADNITQNYPKDLAEQYVSKLYGYVEDGTAIVVAAMVEKELVGFVWGYELSIFDEKRLHIDMIGVKEEYRKKGIASMFLKLEKQEAKKKGIDIIEAMTTRNNEKAYNWFHSMGFADERVKVKLEIR